MSLSVGIFSWNIGDNVTSSHFDQIKLHVDQHTNNQSPDLLVFCFQEVGKKAGDIEKLLWDRYNLQYQIISSDSACFSLTNFQIKTVVLANAIQKKGIRLENKIQHKPECVSFTKGFVETIIQLPLSTLPEIRIYNTHFPFKSPKETRSFYAKLFKRFQSSLRRIPIFVTGDINSRSLLTPECYIKDVVTNCGLHRNENAYCRLNSFLETLPFEESLSVSSRDKYTSTIQVGNCADWQKTFPTNPSMGVVRDLLVQSDFINQSKGSGLFDGFQEGEITFLPTYKRNTSSGVFSLRKGSAGRLPGYADRILFYSGVNHPVQVKTYQSIALKGNDHLPLFGLFRIAKSTSTRYSPYINIKRSRKAKKSYKKKKSSKRQSKKRFSGVRKAMRNKKRTRR